MASASLEPAPARGPQEFARTAWDGAPRHPGAGALAVNPAPKPEPSPYELYIRLAPLAALWPHAGMAWSGRLIACCGYQAAELCLRLIDEARQDRRRAAQPEQRIERFLDHMIEGLDLTHRLLARLPPPPAALTAQQPGAPASPGFAVLAHLAPAQVERVTAALERQVATLPYRSGVEALLGAARKAHGLAPLPGLGADARPALRYRELVSPDTLWRLREAEPCGPEDHLFSTAHQISECWLAIAHHLLAMAQELAQRGDWAAAAAAAMTDAARVVSITIQAGQLLDLMVLADYHPLRVRLRDGSGAQSRAAQRLPAVAEAAGQTLWAALAQQGIDLAEVLEAPAEHLGQYQYLQALKALGRQIQNFLFQHYLLALSVLGTHSIGSLGYGIHKLAERAAHPVFPRINQAHHDYVMLTNFRHGEASGAIIFQNEIAAGWNPYDRETGDAALPPELIEAQVAAYFRCIGARDAEGWVALFDPIEGTLHDVPGTRPYHGAARLRLFIGAMFNAFSDMQGEFSGLRIAGNRASADWHFKAVSYFGQETAFSGREDFVFDADGRIAQATAHWSPADVARQWERGGP